MTHTETARGSAVRGTDAADHEVVELVRCAADGDQRAWNALVDRFNGLVWAVIRGHRLSGADSADVSQTTWLKLVEHLDDLQDPARVGSWLATTARRECLHTLRRGARQVLCPEVLPDMRCVADAPAIDERLMRADRDAELWEAFGRLPERDQALLRMLAADPAPSYEEIGAALGMPLGSIGPTRARSLERLRREREAVEGEAFGALALAAA